tara:strand:+ start:983 stop:1183 length:201 start_codon:yes stop_codon:yes gene_type:complete
MNIKIHLTCEACDGSGRSETQISVDEYRIRECADCDGDGTTSVVETYDSISDAQDDYPAASAFTYL